MTRIAQTSPAVHILSLGSALPTAHPCTVGPPEGFEAEPGPAQLCAPSPGAGIIHPRVLRRIGRIQELALTAAHKAVHNSTAPLARAESVAVAVGTGLGAFTETTAFLDSVFRCGESAPKPKCFVNSVHNSAASQIAIAFGFKGENHTLIHQAISFELALWQAIQILHAGRAEQVLVCGADELNAYAVTVGRKIGLWRRDPGPLEPLAPQGRRHHGTIPGEGAAAVLIASQDESASQQRAPRVAALAVRPRKRPGLDSLSVEDEVAFIARALSRAGRSMESLDFILTGANGDDRLDAAYLSVLEAVAARTGRPVSYGAFKQLCGEFCSASAVGFALAATICRRPRLMPDLRCPGAPEAPSPISNVLLYNLWPRYHSVCLVTT